MPLSRRSFLEGLLAGVGVASTKSTFVFGNGVWQPRADVFDPRQTATYVTRTILDRQRTLQDINRRIRDGQYSEAAWFFDRATKSIYVKLTNENPDGLLVSYVATLPGRIDE